MLPFIKESDETTTVDEYVISKETINKVLADLPQEITEKVFHNVHKKLMKSVFEEFLIRMRQFINTQVQINIQTLSSYITEDIEETDSDKENNETIVFNCRKALSYYSALLGNTGIEGDAECKKHAEEWTNEDDEYFFINEDDPNDPNLEDYNSDDNHHHHYDPLYYHANEAEFI